MAATGFQAGVLKLLASARRSRGESYVAGGVALNVLLAAPRRSRDVDLFHDTTEALHASWTEDRKLLESAGMDVRVVREAPSFVEAIVSQGSGRTAIQWARDSAFRYFPLVEDERLGLALHPFDLATNKVLAMAGRLEVRDWIDVLNCDQRLQPFGYLVWAACGKDPGYNPHSLLATARRLRYSQPEVETLDFGGERPNAAALGEQWHAALDAADPICRLLPAAEAGTCVLLGRSGLFAAGPEALRRALDAGEVTFHRGRIGGSWPEPGTGAGFGPSI